MFGIHSFSLTESLAKPDNQTELPFCFTSFTERDVVCVWGFFIYLFIYFLHKPTSSDISVLPTSFSGDTRAAAAVARSSLAKLFHVNQRKMQTFWGMRFESWMRKFTPHDPS